MPPAGLPKARVVLIFLAPLILLGLAWGTPVAFREKFRHPPVSAATVELTGAQVFAQNCAYCHGPNGDGKGSVILQPPARYFGRDKYKLGTTLKNPLQESIPTDDDLLAVINRGIPGSAMPSFAHLPEAQKHAVIGHLRTLTRKGLYDRLVLKAAKEDEDPEPAKFWKIVVPLSEPGPKLAIPAFPVSTTDSVARGKALFQSEAWGCSTCHGKDGKGDGPQTQDPKFLNDDGTPAKPRDLTQGIYKGGGEPHNLYARIVLGIPGTPMPDSAGKPKEQIADLIHYLQSLAK